MGCRGRKFEEILWYSACKVSRKKTKFAENENQATIK